MTREEWKAIEAKLVYQGARVKLQCDSYVVDLVVHRQKMRLSVFVFVDGQIDPKWLREDCDERRRFMRPVVHKPKAFSAKDIRDFGKRACADAIKRGTFTWYSPEWPSVMPLSRHLDKHNTSVTLAVATPETPGTENA
jgi:hypothetical protein